METEVPGNHWGGVVVYGRWKGAKERCQGWDQIKSKLSIKRSFASECRSDDTNYTAWCLFTLAPNSASDFFWGLWVLWKI